MVNDPPGREELIKSCCLSGPLGDSFRSTDGTVYRTFTRFPQRAVDEPLTVIRRPVYHRDNISCHHKCEEGDRVILTSLENIANAIASNVDFDEFLGGLELCSPTTHS